MGACASTTPVIVIDGGTQRQQQPSNPSRLRPTSNTSISSVGVKLRGTSAQSHISADSGIDVIHPKNRLDRQPLGTTAGTSISTTAGTSISTRPVMGQLRGGDRAANSARILESLKEEGLLGDKSTNTSSGGLVYEIALDNLRAPPSRHGRPSRLEQCRTNINLTEQELKLKLDNAEHRRKDQVNAKLSRNRENETKTLAKIDALFGVDRPPNTTSIMAPPPMLTQQ